MFATYTEQIDLFDASRWPRRPYCTDDLAAGLRIRSLKQALTKPYIQANPPHLRVWSIYDIDRPGGGLAWEAANLPPPAWSSVNRENAHAHLVYGITAPVLVDGLGVRDAPLRYLCAVEPDYFGKLSDDSVRSLALQAQLTETGTLERLEALAARGVISPVQASDWGQCLHFLMGLKLQRGDRIGIIGLNQLEWLLLFYAAAKIGDDALQRGAGRAVVPESFTHGTSAQRQRWFDKGLKTGSVKGCDTFSSRTI